MSDTILHECGIALIRLRKPLSYYIEKYGPTYAMTKMYILMEKQHNRGQDGAGIANIKIDQKPGFRFFSRYRSIKAQPVAHLFKKIAKKYKKAQKDGKEKFRDEHWLKENVAFSGELWLGHLRYGTHGLNSIENVHPFLRQNNWRSRNLVMAGNFNMTNVEELFNVLVDLGQHPKDKVDTVTVMEKIGHFLDEEVQSLFEKYKDHYSNKEVSDIIENELNLQNVLRRACKDFDGGYAMAGLTGSGSAFVVRDPSGIRPAYYYADEEVVVVASEKQAIKTAFNVNYEQIEEVKPGCALVINKNGEYSSQTIIPALEKTSCSFERIYFSRGTDPEIYQERKQLGKLLVPQILKAINFDLKNTIFSYIPNTAETAFLGMMAGIEEYLITKQKEIIIEGKPSVDSLEDILSFRPRIEKIVLKDVKLRTFITDDEHRDEMVAHVYDTTYEVVNKGKDTLVVIDDSIVRGTTLEKSILKMLDRLGPKKIVVVSSAPQIRFPDCYGIDMSKMGDFVAFRAVIKLLKEQGKDYLLGEVYEQCQQSKLEETPNNYVKRLYKEFTPEEISAKITDIVRPEGMKAELEVVYQTIENLHKAIPNHSGDWYFTGNYPTPGGMKVANKSYLNYMDGKLVRAY
ncbi:MAG: amidophosphoribosyltransferase [Bacteroidota bacterium]|jgi:amidophosphoribosyltransferase|nr:amidophosphoribosyltransferase [Bacteroidota bacterium]MCA4899582.1 amidophosphoribosyltransferase [Cytophagales bacterium]MCE2958810.1 amidophosphoribosyltransferase [Flammeovirgaceae bacterium]MCZ8069770.1 amidophosphoribosyltransferase [Cytophagales bacterium]